MPILLEAIEKERTLHSWNLELIMVDDGSSDNSFAMMKQLHTSYPYIRGFRLSRNFGHQAAVRTGLSLCQGDYIAIIDDDLQDPPSLLPGFFKYLDEGFDVAYGVRRKRKESWFKVYAYNAFYRILKILSDIDMPLDTGDFCVMKKEVVKQMLQLSEQNPFLRGIRAWVGFKQTGVEYERSERLAGESGYSIKKLFKIAFDGIFSFSRVPLRIITILGTLGLIITVSYTSYILIKYFSIGVVQPGFVTLIIMIMFFGSLNLACVGILGEYISRIYSETQRRPHAIIAECID
ncbi:MAG: glycosyltransferase family 2 protein [SAR324 cluster bacterium]|nr:glycosyltransferase family 2 protein [SAR324 cluster bacterium]